MALSKVTGVAKAVIRGLEKRPWIPMVVYLVIFVLFVAVSWTLLANLVDSKWRLMPVLSASAKLTIEEVVSWTYKLLQVAGVVSVVVVPCVMLCSMRFKSAFYALVMGVAGIAASATFMLLTAPIWFILGIEALDARQELGKDKVVTVYRDYSEAASSSEELGRIIPPGATNITVVSKVYFQGYSDDFRCSVSEEDFRKFVDGRNYVFCKYDLEEDLGSSKCFLWHNDKHTLFSQFPDLRDGKVVDHHSDGFFSCVANDHIQNGNPKERSLQYVYDAKCSILWARCWW